MVPFPMTLNKP